jgi:hypothetical protein
MSAILTLPAPLHTRLAALQRRIRLLRAVRGCAWLVLGLGFSAAAALFADSWLDLSPLTRQILFAMWLGEGLGLLLFGIVVPLGRRIDAAALAAVIEEKYPDFSERLTSAVELAGTAEEGHGSPLLIGLLLEETAERSRNVDFRPAVPARRAVVLAVLAVVAALAAGVSALVWPEQYGNLAQRFFRPWNLTPVVSPYALTVTSGHVIAARGRTITLSAHVAPRNDKIVVPDAATLVVAESDGRETRLPMMRAKNGDFTFAFKVSEDVFYRIEAGEVVSDSYQVTAIAPVELAADSPRITITPPTYARSVKEEETFQGLVDLSALQHSEIRFDFRFSRPAAAAYLEMIPNSQGSAENVAPQALPLSADRQAATLSFKALNGGKYRLILEAEHAIRTELPGGVIHVQPDRPPSVTRFAGTEQPRSVLPYDRIPLEIEAGDDIGVAGIELEYRINDGESERQALELQGGNTPAAVARHVVELAGKVKEDDRLFYRFHVRDNLPQPYQGPHVVVYPADRWLTLRIARRGDPLKQQEILAQRDDINRRLQAIRTALIQQKDGVDKIGAETRYRSSLPRDRLDRVKQLQQENRTSQKDLRDLARGVEEVPALQPVAELARDMADQEMPKSQQALEQTLRKTTPAERNRAFDKAGEQLDSAAKRLDQLQKANERVAQERLDQIKLETLADREKRLAEQAAELAAKHPVLDPKAREWTENLKREQEQLAQELERLGQQSEALKQALEKARQEQARRMAERARELAKAQRELARAEVETEHRRNVDRLAELARQQQELAERQAKLARETNPTAPQARTAPLKTEEARRAAEALKQGDAPEAMRRQEQAANELDRLAQAFERAAKASADPKEAARQLEQAEKALRQRLNEEAASKEGKQPLVERLKPLAEEQKAIQRATESLSVPPAHTEANKLKQQIDERAAQAADAIRKQDTPKAQARMDETKNLLHRLSGLLPSLDQRRQQARRELERIRRRQDEIARQVEPIKKDDPSAPQRLAEAARRQAEAAEALKKLDAPNQDKRRERTAEALQRALVDLRHGRQRDVSASQREAKRQLERLDQALRGEKPADERARDDAAAQANQLALQQRQLANEVALAKAEKATPQEAKRAAVRQAELARQLKRLPSQEVLPQVVETRLRMADAALALERAKAPADAKRVVARAAESAEKLAEQLGPARTTADNAAPSILPSKEQSEQARQLARQQRALREAVQQARQSANGDRPPAQQQKQQRDLQQEAGELRRQFQRLSQQSGTPQPMQSDLQHAAEASQQARQAMQQAREQAQRGESAAKKQSQERAAQALDQASRAASLGENHPPQSEIQKADHGAEFGEAVAKAGQQMAAAQGQLAQGKPAQAQTAMRQAAQALAQAARQMAGSQQQPGQPGPSGQPIGLGRLPGGVPDLSVYGVEKTAYAGKTWGELPGELRTKIVQDMKTRYGEDYARMIKYYFEHIADTRKMTR